MTFRPRPNHPYAFAPRFPDEPEVDISSLFPLVPEGPVELGFGAEGALVATRSPIVELEIGPGRGGFLFERAAVRPQARLLGLEIRLKWAAIVDERLRKQGLGDRVRVLNADARDALPRLRPDASIAVVYLHFPDPWWKERHRKRFVMSPPLLDAVARLLVDEGELFVQTDVADRAAMYEEQIGAHPELAPFGDEAGAARLAENPYGARSHREQRAMADGLPIVRLRYRRVRRRFSAEPED